MPSAIFSRQGLRALTTVTRLVSVQTSYGPNNCAAIVIPARSFASKASPAETDAAAAAAAPRSAFHNLLSRVLAPNKETGKNSLLRVLGYYTAESKSIGAGRTLSEQIIKRSNAAIAAELGDTTDFMPKFELYSAHLYVTLRRLRSEKGTTSEKDCTLAMDILSECFWDDVRYRMMMDEGGLTLIQSSKWIKECQKIFYGIAVSLDETWGDTGKMNESVAKGFSFLSEDATRVSRFRSYMMDEFSRLEAATIPEIWEGYGWDSNYLVTKSSPQ